MANLECTSQTFIFHELFLQKDANTFSQRCIYILNIYVIRVIGMCHLIPKFLLPNFFIIYDLFNYQTIIMYISTLFLRFYRLDSDFVISSKLLSCLLHSSFHFAKVSHNSLLRQDLLFCKVKRKNYRLCSFLHVGGTWFSSCSLFLFYHIRLVCG